MNKKFSNWYNSQSATTQAWLAKQAIWHDSDMFKAFTVGTMVGFVIGVMII
jgi:hypothetical protein